MSNIDLVRIILAFLAIAAAKFASANPSTKYRNLKCDNIKNTAELFDCAISQRLDILRADAQVKIAEHGWRKFDQTPNPELEADSSASISDGKSFGFNINYRQPILRGGKRKAQVELAKSEYILQKTGLELAKFEAAKAIAADLFSIFILKEEIENIEEMISSYRKLIAIFGNRNALSPAARISMDVFRLALYESEINLKARKDQLIAHYNEFTELGISLAKISGLSPERWPEWPSISTIKGSNDLPNPQIDALNNRVSQAQNELSLEKSYAYQDISIGPLLAFENIDDSSSWGIGVSIEMSLPVNNKNEGGVRASLEKLNANQDFASKANTIFQRKLKNLLDRYSVLLTSINSLPSEEYINSAHRRLEREAQNGLIEASLIIEGHEQGFKLLESRNQFKLQILEVLSEIYTLKGKSLKELFQI